MGGPANMRGHSGNQNDDGPSFMGDGRIGNIRSQTPGGQPGGSSYMGGLEPGRDERSSSRGRFGSMVPDSLDNERHSSMRAPNSFGRTNPNEAPNNFGESNSMEGKCHLRG